MTLVNVMEPLDGMLTFERVTTITAGRITAVMAGGCYVTNGENSQHFRTFDTAMDGRHGAQVGDYWVIDQGGRQFVMTKAELEANYMLKKQDEPDHGEQLALPPPQEEAKPDGVVADTPKSTGRRGRSAASTAGETEVVETGSNTAV